MAKGVIAPRYNSLRRAVAPSSFQKGENLRQCKEINLPRSYQAAACGHAEAILPIGGSKLKNTMSEPLSRIIGLDGMEEGMELDTLEIRQVGHTFGAELRGLNAQQPLSKRELDALVAALDRYGVVILPEQFLSPEQQIAISEQLGPLENSDEGSPSFQKLRENMKYVDSRVSEISNLTQDQSLLDETDVRRLFTFANQLWHSDSTFRPIRARYTSLSAVRLPESGGDTEFADVASAYEALSDNDKSEIEGLYGVHSPTIVMEQLGATRQDGGGFVSHYGTQSRPIVETHPGSGRKILNVPSHCSHIEGKSLPEGRSLLTYLREQATLPEFRYRHKWSLGDFVIWDNRSTLHRACRFKERTQGRQLVRTVVQDL